MLRSENTSLVTLTGPGGAGKTRLAIEIARQTADAFKGAVWFVPLAALSDARLIPHAVVDALRLEPAPTATAAAALEQAADALSQQPSLLVLDNFEQVVEEGTAMVRALLERAPTLTCLVTSRQRLGLSGEQEFPILPLPTPSMPLDTVLPYRETPERLLEFSSVHLFVDRAQQVRPDFQLTWQNAESVAKLVGQLEGIPLAIELAAARAGVLTPQQMLFQLQNRFEFLISRRRDVEARHRTLRSAIDWSYQLVLPELQRFFACLSVFRGGWTFEAAQAVCEEPQALDYLEQLREYSLLLSKEQNGKIRFYMLESLREYAEDQLSPEQRAELRRRHVGYFLRVAETTHPSYETAEWQSLMEADYDNLRAALEWSPQGEILLRFVVAMSAFWEVRGYLAEASEWLTRALQQISDDAPAALRIKALQLAASFALYQGDYTFARVLTEESLCLCRDSEEEKGIAEALFSLGFIAFLQADYAPARSLLEESLALRRKLHDKRGIGVVLNRLGILLCNQGDYFQAGLLLTEGLEWFQELQDTGGIAGSLGHLGLVAWYQGDYASAQSYFEESITLVRQISDQWSTAFYLTNQGSVMGALGDHERARALHEESLALFRKIGDRRTLAYTLNNLAVTALRQGDPAQARLFHTESLTLRQHLGDKRGIAYSLEGFAALASTDAPERAARLWGAAAALREALILPLPPVEHAEYNHRIATARRMLGEKAFTDAWAWGSAMTWETAAEYALDSRERHQHSKGRKRIPKK